MPVVRTVIQDFHDRSGSKIRKLASLTGPTSYATGGEAILTALGLSRVELFLVEAASNGTDLRLVRYDYTANTVKWFDLAGAEIAAATDLSTYTARFEAIGH